MHRLRVFLKPGSNDGVVICRTAPIPYVSTTNRTHEGPTMPKLPKVLVGFFAAGLVILATQAVVKLF